MMADKSTKRGSLIVISGFSGVGKGTVVKRLVSDFGYNLSVSATTRSPREGEVDGREYYFMDRKDFENLIDYGGLSGVDTVCRELLMELQRSML